MNAPEMHPPRVARRPRWKRILSRLACVLLALALVGYLTRGFFRATLRAYAIGRSWIAVENLGRFLPHVDEVEILALGGEVPSSTPNSFSPDIGPSLGTVDRHTVHGAEADEIANLWRDIHFAPDSRALCHQPYYALRFRHHGKLVLETSVCWNCHTYTLPVAPFGRIESGFDADSDPAQKLLSVLIRYAPHPRIGPTAPSHLHTFCLVGSLASPDIRPAIVNVPSFESSPWSDFQTKSRPLNDVWHAFERHSISVQFAPELASRLSAAVVASPGAQSWKQFNTKPIHLPFKGEDDGSKMLSFLRSILDAFPAGSESHLHFEPLTPTTLSFHRAPRQNVTTFVLTDGEESKIKNSEFAVASELFVSRFRTPSSKRRPRDTAEAWRLIIEGESGDSGAQFLEYDSALNMVILKSDGAWVDEFLRRWEES